MSAVERWAGGDQSSEAKKELAALGAPKEVIAQIESADADFEVWPENWEVVNLFLRLSTQWIVTQGAVVGLNYQSVNFLFDLLKIESRESVFSDLQIMEFHALSLVNKREK